MNGGNFVSFKRVILLGGALSAYLIGAATATGQESMQFYTSHGYIGIASAIITLILFGWASSSLIVLGNKAKDSIDSVYKYYFGKIFGSIFEWFVILFLFGLVVTMISASGTIFYESFGTNRIIGSVIMTILIFLTVLLSLQRLVDVLGIIAPVIIVFAIVISIISIMNNLAGLSNAEQLLSGIEVVSAVDSWLLSSILYAAFGITVAAPFLIEMGSTTENSKTALLGGMTGTMFFVLTILSISLALLANINLVFDKGTPLVFLAEGFHPILGLIFSIIILAGVYTTGAPMFWYVTEQFRVISKKSHKIIAVPLIIIAFLGGQFLPFDELVGTVYPLTGVLGIFLFIAIAFKQIKMKIQKGKYLTQENIMERK